MRKIILAFFAFILLASGAVLAYAPYLPRLVSEGYPPLAWPASGHFANIEGAPPPGILPAPVRKLAPDLLSALEESGGKALLVDVGGRLELEYYAHGVAAETRLNSFSMAKSLVAALVFKALAEGRIDSLDTPIGRILPDYGDESLRAVSPRALLLMQSGIVFEGDVSSATGAKDMEAVRFDPFGPMARLHVLGPEAIRTGLTADPRAASRFSYQNVNTALLGAALERLYARSLSALLSEKLWRPAGASDAVWRQYRAGSEVSPYCCIFATARDWIRIGRYLMRNGEPQAPFLPDSIWRQLMGTDLDAAALRKGVYGYHLRHDLLDRAGEPLQGPFTYMLGQGGQVLYMMPQHDLVVLRSGERMQRLHSTLYAAWRTIRQTATP